jgi:RNA polymerase sigma factor (sigma-70 family)
MGYMSKYPAFIQENLQDNKKYYSLYDMDNILRCKGDSSYLGEVMVANEDLIWHSVHKYVGKPETLSSNYRVDKDDILQLGRLGFFKAIMAFDLNYGTKFSSFAVTAIVREIKCYLRDSANIIRPTRTANELINRIGRLEAELGYLPSIDDISIMLDEQEERVKKALQIGKTVKYLDEPVSSPRNNLGASTVPITSLDLIVDGAELEADVVDKVLVDSIIDSIRDKLTDKEVSVLRHRIDGFSQTQTANKESISQMRVSRIVKKVATLLKDMDLIAKEAE